MRNKFLFLQKQLLRKYFMLVAMVFLFTTIVSAQSTSWKGTSSTSWTNAAN